MQKESSKTLEERVAAPEEEVERLREEREFADNEAACMWLLQRTSRNVPEWCDPMLDAINSRGELQDQRPVVHGASEPLREARELIVCDKRHGIAPCLRFMRNRSISFTSGTVREITEAIHEAT